VKKKKIWTALLKGSDVGLWSSCTLINVITFICKGKGKAIPLQAWTGPEGSRRLRLPDFKTVDT